jgi:phenylacetate-CoA ligase
MSGGGCQSEERLLHAFRRAAAGMPWYRTLLEEHGAEPDRIVDLASFSTRCPYLSKRNTFDRFPLDELAATTSVEDVATVLTSSGHGGRFSFGLSTRRQAAAGAGFIDDALDEAFGVKSRSTLAINCLPMGVGFASERMTVATTSVREDMAVALVQAFGKYYEQILLVADPLFIKRLTDHAADRGMDWTRHIVHVVLGEEIFGERFRAYIASCLGRNQDQSGGGYIMSSFGVGELGLHLGYETPATIALRRAASANPAVARDVLGVENGWQALPTVLTFDSARTFMEIAEPDHDGFGLLTISMLDPDQPIPLLRYQTGDVAKLLEPGEVADALREHGIVIPGVLPSSLLALRGRSREALPNGSHVGFYKDVLYADHATARDLTGAFRVSVSEGACTLYVQLVRSVAPSEGLERRLLEPIPADVRPARLVLWPYEQFPFGMTLDYERKFAYCVP